jgi:hypothetical protein
VLNKLKRKGSQPLRELPSFDSAGDCLCRLATPVDVGRVFLDTH